MNGADHPPMSYLHAFGARAEPVVTLTWALLVLSILVCLIMGLAVALGVWRRRVRGEVALSDVPPARGRGGLAWIVWGVGITTPILLASFVWTSLVLAETGSAPNSRVTVEIIGHQWWWEARYLADDPQAIFYHRQRNPRSDR